jgi:chromosome segregation and condensation protein ScpB
MPPLPALVPCTAAVVLNGKQVNTVQAIWASSKADVTEEAYVDFYKFKSGDFEAPLFRLHFSSDAPTSIKALLFVGLPGGRPLSSRTVAGLVRGVRPEEVDDLALELQRRCRANNCPYEVASRDDGWVMRLRPEFARFGSVLEGRARLVRLDAESLDVLAVVAWNQPVPRDRLVELGCDARPATLRQLVRRGLLELRHAEGDGEGGPTYHTTQKFLEVFRLTSLADLPDPHEPPP